MSVPRTDVLVIGGGIIGAAVADAVAAGGTPVVLLERAQVGSAASSGAAGLLAPLVEAEGPGPFLELALAGRAMFRDAAAALLRDTGVDVGYRETGTLRVAEDDGVARELRHRVSWERERGLGVRWLEPAELASREPLLHEGLSGALFSADDHQVTSSALTHALARRAAARGAVIVEGLGVERLLRVGDRVVGVRTTRGEEYRAKHVVLAAGPWSSTLVPRVTVRPLKGQLVHLRSARTLSHPIFGSDVYIVAKADDRIVVGATVEDVGFDWAPREEATRSLLDRAFRLIPALRDAEVLDAWAGLRPGTPDRLPIIGVRRDAQGLIFATGHFRNGVLLSLITGRIVAAIAAGEPSPVDIAAFSPERFA
ncbi:MAG: glycine oxidase ThiO [Chloroflexi bacterium]|nr:MAG: glycine oxidase ThiO [Chloroflexota bacterium]